MVKKVSVFKCDEHGEVEILDRQETDGKDAFCPDCGSKMSHIKDYEE